MIMLKDALNYHDLQEKLYTAVILDILDEIGYRNQAMSHQIRPLKAETVVMGRAFTILATDVYTVPAEPYKLELAAVDCLQKDDIVVATTNGSVTSGFWGELLTTVAKCRGAKGGVIDGFTRDTKQIMTMDFPLYVRGIHPLDSKGRTDVIAYQVPIKCGGVVVNPGDIVFADNDGIAVIPKAVEQAVLIKALEKVRGENTVRKEILAGASATEVWKKYHIL
jgi:regulator of RNase E activity RraA